MNSAATLRTDDESYLRLGSTAAARPVEVRQDGSVVPRSFPSHCEDEFNYLAKVDPARLASLISAELKDRPELLTFAAEAAGQIPYTPVVMRVLGPLLSHLNSVVREGAILGLSTHLSESVQARQWVRQLARSDPSPSVRAAAEDALALVA